MSTTNNSMRVYSHPGAAEGALSMEIDILAIRHALVVTDRSIAGSGLVQRLCRLVPAEIAITIYAEAPRRPTETAASDAATLYAVHGCDGIIGIGNRATLDLAKLTGLLATHRGPLLHYDRASGGADRVRDAIPPIIAITVPAPEDGPTAPHTNDEVDSGCEAGHNIISMHLGGRQIEIYSAYLMPKAAIADRELT